MGHAADDPFGLCILQLIPTDVEGFLYHSKIFRTAGNARDLPAWSSGAVLNAVALLLNGTSAIRNRRLNVRPEELRRENRNFPTSKIAVLEPNSRKNPQSLSTRKLVFHRLTDPAP
jgi:hypothetical protein